MKTTTSKYLIPILILALLLVPAFMWMKDYAAPPHIEEKGPAEDKKPLPNDIKSLKALAEKGDAVAQYQLAEALFWGKGGNQDLKQAAVWRINSDSSLTKIAYIVGKERRVADGYYVLQTLIKIR